MPFIPKSNTEPWYWGYAFQGAVVLGTAPILIPIIVAKGSGAAHAGAVVAAFYLGQLTAPLWGMLADRTKLHRVVFLGGFVMLALGLGLFALVSGLLAWSILAFVQGAGAGASNTVAGMNIVEFRPRAEWEPRIGWLQTMYGTGQAVGLLLAAVVQRAPALGMILSAALMAPGIFFGRVALPGDGSRTKQVGLALKHRRLRHPRTHLHLLHHFHRPSLAGLKHLLTPWRSNFGLFLASWFFVMFGSWMVYNLYPLVMHHVYGIDAGLSSLYYAIAAGIGIFAYAPSGTWGHRLGDNRIYLLGVGMTVLSVGLLTLFAFWSTPANWWLVPISFIILPVAWSPLIVSGTAITAALTPIEQGEAMGMFNATTAIGSVLSALAAGGLASKLGYASIPPVAGLFVAAGLGLMVWLVRQTKSNRAREEHPA